MAIVLSSQGITSGAFGTFTAGMGHGTTNYYSAAVLMKLDESGPFDLTTLMPASGGTVSVVGSANIATAQVSVTTGNITVVAARAGRFAVTIMNTGTTPVYLGITGVSITTGILLSGVVGASITLPTAAAVFGTVASGTQTVCVLETF